MERIIALDPGRQKCGMAVFDDGSLVHKRVLATGELKSEVLQWYNEHSQLLVGDRTGSKNFISELREMFGIMKEDIILVDEHRTTLEARTRYWQEHPPKGWRRWLPTTMQEPPEPVDDYVAVILAERYFRQVIGG